MRVKELLEIDACFERAPAESEEGNRERKRFLKLALEMSSEKGPWKNGDPVLHFAMASAAIKSKDFPLALKHLVHSHRPEELNKLIIVWSKAGPDSEIDLHYTRAILQLLCLENLRDANILFKFLKAEFPSLDTPLIRFDGFLLRTLQRDAHPLFTTLRTKYSQAIGRGNVQGGLTFDVCLDKIAHVFYGVALQKSGMESMMENLMKMF